MCGCPAASGAYRPVVRTSRWGCPHCGARVGPVGAPQGPMGAPQAPRIARCPSGINGTGMTEGPAGGQVCYAAAALQKERLPPPRKWDFWLSAPPVPCTEPGCFRTGTSRLLPQCQGKAFPAQGRVPGSLPAPGGAGVPRPPSCRVVLGSAFVCTPRHTREGPGASTKQRRLPLQSLVSEPKQDLADPPPHIPSPGRCC